MTAWRDIKSSSAEIEFAAPQGVRDVIASLGRTEDIRFSPDNRRLAVAAFIRNRIAIFDVEIERTAAGKSVALTGVVEISSSSFMRPHGLDFLDDETLIVASREGDAAIFRLPAGGAGCRTCELSPIQVMRAGGAHGLNAPGSIWVSPGDQRRKEILVCNNSANTLTRHALDLDAGCLASGGVLLEKWLDVPDGVSVSSDRRWIAVSNHNTHNVLLFENSAALNRGSEPDGILRCVHYPHGLRFVGDDEYIFVADAGAPYVHLYARDSQDWRGVRNPAASFRIMDDALFQRGRHNPQEGGPKGIDIDGGMNVLVATSECQPLAFFDLSAMLGLPLRGLDASPELLGSARREQQALQIRYEFEVLEHARRAQAHAEARATRAKAKLAAMKRSASWRMTAPLRWVRSALRRLG